MSTSYTFIKNTEDSRKVEVIGNAICLNGVEEAYALMAARQDFDRQPQGGDGTPAAGRHRENPHGRYRMNPAEQLTQTVSAYLCGRIQKHCHCAQGGIEQMPPWVFVNYIGAVPVMPTITIGYHLENNVSSCSPGDCQAAGSYST